MNGIRRKVSDISKESTLYKESVDISENLSKYKSPSRRKKRINTAKENTTFKISKKTSNKKVVWKNEYIEVVKIDSFKKYNFNNTHDQSSLLSKDKKIKCNCLIF